MTQVWNSIEAIDGAGAIRRPLRQGASRAVRRVRAVRELLPIDKISPGAIDMTAGPGPRTLALPGLPPFAPLVCYEAIFPGAVVDAARAARLDAQRHQRRLVRPQLGPYQHFAIARTRAIEEGLPLVRAANNGISGVVDAAGRVVARPVSTASAMPIWRCPRPAA